MLYARRVSPLSERTTRSGPLQIVLTFKTLLLAVALFLLTWAVVSIRDTLLIVAVGIFLGLVFEGPVRLVERKTPLGRGMSATVTVIGALVAVTLLLLVLLKPLLEGLQSFLKDLPQLVEQLRSSDELSSVGDTSAADSVQSGAQSVSDAVPNALGALVGFAGSIASAALAVFLITFICLFFLCEVGDLKKALASVLPQRQEDVWLPLWDRITTMVSRWAIGVVIIATIAGTTQGVTAWLLGSSYAVALGLIAGFLDMIPNIGATIAGFILVPTLLAEEGLTAALIMLAVDPRLPADREQHPHADHPGQGGQALRVLHHRRRRALRRPARRGGRADRRPGRCVDPDHPRRGHEDLPRGGGARQGGRRSGCAVGDETTA